MKDEYQLWCDDNVDGDPIGRCAEVTLDMQRAFPHLKRVRGHYVLTSFRKTQYEHWWLVDVDGTIVDPTAAQFPPRGLYVEHEGPEPTGRCPNCGGYCFNNAMFCSECCAVAYQHYVTGEGRY